MSVSVPPTVVELLVELSSDLRAHVAAEDVELRAVRAEIADLRAHVTSLRESLAPDIERRAARTRARKDLLAASGVLAAITAVGAAIGAALTVVWRAINWRH